MVILQGIIGNVYFLDGIHNFDNACHILYSLFQLFIGEAELSELCEILDHFKIHKSFLFSEF